MPCLGNIKSAHLSGNQTRLSISVSSSISDHLNASGVKLGSWCTRFVRALIIGDITCCRNVPSHLFRQFLLFKCLIAFDNHLK